MTPVATIMLIYKNINLHKNLQSIIVQFDFLQKRNIA